MVACKARTWTTYLCLLARPHLNAPEGMLTTTMTTWTTYLCLLVRPHPNAPEGHDRSSQPYSHAGGMAKWLATPI